MFARFLCFIKDEEKLTFLGSKGGQRTPPLADRLTHSVHFAPAVSLALPQVLGHKTTCPQGTHPSWEDSNSKLNNKYASSSLHGDKHDGGK